MLDGAAEETAPGWEAVVRADSVFYDRFDVGSVPFPFDAPERQFALTGAEVVIGRGRPSDPGGPARRPSAPPRTWPSPTDSDGAAGRRGGMVDHRSGLDNGTFLNDREEPLVADEPVGMGPGDEIHVGAWTTIVLRPCAAGAATAVGPSATG